MLCKLSTPNERELANSIRFFDHLHRCLWRILPFVIQSLWHAKDPWLALSFRLLPLQPSRKSSLNTLFLDRLLFGAIIVGPSSGVACGLQSSLAGHLPGFSMELLARKTSIWTDPTSFRMAIVIPSTMPLSALAAIEVQMLNNSSNVNAPLWTTTNTTNVRFISRKKVIKTPANWSTDYL